MNHCKLDPCVYDVFDFGINSGIKSLTPGTLCISFYLQEQTTEKKNFITL
jgi:hypothetical protein